MIDLEAIGHTIHWRGYPVRYMSEDCWDVLYPEVQASLAETLRRAVDLAGPGEPADWYFADRTGETTIWIERAGGFRDRNGHHGGYWTMYLPDER